MMKKQSLLKLIQENRYPGRGIVLGRHSSGSIVVVYFIMGRSENSRNRVFVEKAGGIITEAADPAKMQDPSLIIYAPVRTIDNHTIVTNGDQTDTIHIELSAGGTFESALATRTFEPDSPNYTPRISGIISMSLEDVSYQLSILKSANGNPNSTQRFFFKYSNTVCGEGHFIHTYQNNTSPLLSFSGEPVLVNIDSDIDTFGKELWGSLDTENKVSLFVKYIALDGKEETRIFNRYKKV